MSSGLTVMRIHASTSPKNRIRTSQTRKIQMLVRMPEKTEGMALAGSPVMASQRKWGLKKVARTAAPPFVAKRM